MSGVSLDTAVLTFAVASYVVFVVSFMVIWRQGNRDIAKRLREVEETMKAEQIPQVIDEDFPVPFGTRMLLVVPHRPEDS